MATVPAKNQQPLHNFSLPFLKWGQRIQVNNHCRRRHRNSPPADSSDSDLHNRRKPHRFQFHNSTKGKTVLPEKGNGSEKVTDADAATADDGDVKPWNLRPRRLAIDADDRNGAVATVSCAKSGRLLRGTASAAGAAGAAGSAAAAAVEESEEQRRKRRLWISLSKEEIEEDVYAFTGSRPARRPKKRNRTAQKQVDNVFPGLYLVGISADSYRV